VSRKTQRTGTFGRLTNVTADGGKTSGKQSSHPGDNLDAGNGSEEDGVENRSEPQDWLADGSPDSTGSVPDVSPAAGVKTAPPLFGAESAAASADSDAEHSSSSAPDPAPAGGGDQDAWEPRVPGNGVSGNGSFSNGGSTAFSNGGSSAAAGRPSPDASQGPAMVSTAGAAAGVAGAPLMSAPYASDSSPYASDSSRGPQATAPFSAPTKSRPRPSRPGKASRTQQSVSGQRPMPAGFPAQGGPSSRKAQLAIARVEPWSVMKFSFMISLVGWVILFVAVALMYFVLQKIGVFTSIENTVGLVTASKTRAGTDAASWFSASRVLGYTMLIGAVNVILITALATIGSVLYNLVTMLAGGIEITLKETD
jgi:hypothetical protein